MMPPSPKGGSWPPPHKDCPPAHHFARTVMSAKVFEHATSSGTALDIPGGNTKLPPKPPKKRFKSVLVPHHKSDSWGSLRCNDLQLLSALVHAQSLNTRN